MRIHDDHMYHGAALIQIAEHDRFTAINPARVGGQPSRSAYLVNTEIRVYLKYASKPTAPLGEYVFTFNQHHLEELEAHAQTTRRLFLALVCVQGREICCLPYQKFKSLMQRRRAAKGDIEDQYTLLVTAPMRKSLRVYMNAPGHKKTMLGKPLLITRNDFPSCLFNS